MKTALQITQLNICLPEDAKKRIRNRVQKLNQHFDRLTNCRVTVECPGDRPSKLLNYKVRIDITAPGGELAVAPLPSNDLNAAIRNAFDAAGRQIENFVRRLRAEVGKHRRPVTEP